LAAGARCATDVTGFGLLGHASHVARASGVTLWIDAAAVPVLSGAREAWRAGARTGGAERNEAYLEALVDFGAADVETRALLVDPQTSGGLLVSLSPDAAEAYVTRIPAARIIGEVVPRGPRQIALR
ncbi:MAG TPA: AIR synthase-related protein, partial [Gemmatimonadaceae bacterium]|nr:AIR synthase-related protein [Gemmatimonadaceae bacterium]